MKKYIYCSNSSTMINTGTATPMPARSLVLRSVARTAIAVGGGSRLEDTAAGWIWVWLAEVFATVLVAKVVTVTATMFVVCTGG